MGNCLAGEDIQEKKLIKDLKRPEVNPKGQPAEAYYNITPENDKYKNKIDLEVRQKNHLKINEPYEKGKVIVLNF